jgi:hypothetical protein
VGKIAKIPLELLEIAEIPIYPPGCQSVKADSESLRLGKLCLKKWKHIRELIEGILEVFRSEGSFSLIKVKSSKI